MRELRPLQLLKKQNQEVEVNLTNKRLILMWLLKPVQHLWASERNYWQEWNWMKRRISKLTKERLKLPSLIYSFLNRSLRTPHPSSPRLVLPLMTSMMSLLCRQWRLDINSLRCQQECLTWARWWATWRWELTECLTWEQWWVTQKWWRWPRTWWKIPPWWKWLKVWWEAALREGHPELTLCKRCRTCRKTP